MADTVAESISVTRSRGKLRRCCSTRDTCCTSASSASGDEDEDEEDEEEDDEDNVLVFSANLLLARTLWLSVCLPLLLKIRTGSIFTIGHKIFTLLS